MIDRTYIEPSIAELEKRRQDMIKTFTDAVEGPQPDVILFRGSVKELKTHCRRIGIPCPTLMKG